MAGDPAFPVGDDEEAFGLLELHAATRTVTARMHAADRIHLLVDTSDPPGHKCSLALV